MLAILSFSETPVWSHRSPGSRRWPWAARRDGGRAVKRVFWGGFGLLIAFRASLRGSAGRNAGPGEPFPAEPGGGGGRGLG